MSKRANFLLEESLANIESFPHKAQFERNKIRIQAQMKSSPRLRLKMSKIREQGSTLLHSQQQSLIMKVNRIEKKTLFTSFKGSICLSNLWLYSFAIVSTRSRCPATLRYWFSLLWVAKANPSLTNFGVSQSGKPCAIFFARIFMTMVWGTIVHLVLIERAVNSSKIELLIKFVILLDANYQDSTTLPETIKFLPAYFYCERKYYKL